MSRAHAAWWGAVGILGLVDVLASKHSHATLSCAIRHTLGTDERSGRIRLVAGWGVLTVWLLPHLLRHELDDALDQIDLGHLTD